ncbi:MAG: hypothetical protein OXC07_01575 [Kistimonas sp.]|nr:hypothetical protein [Kistimonas sp.]
MGSRVWCAGAGWPDSRSCRSGLPPAGANGRPPTRRSRRWLEPWPLVQLLMGCSRVRRWGRASGPTVGTGPGVGTRKPGGFSCPTTGNRRPVEDEPLAEDRRTPDACVKTGLTFALCLRAALDALF